jgi:tight adherence protein B
VTYVTAARPGEHVKLTVTVPGAGQAARTVAFTSAAGVGADSVVKPIIPASAYSTAGTLAIGGTVAFLVLLACAFMLSARKGKWVRSRLEPHLGTVKKATKARRRDQRRELRARFVATVERTFGNLRQFKRLQRQIERADLPLRAAELLAIAAGIGFGLAVVLLIAGAGFFMAFLAFLFGLAAPIAYVTFKAGSRLKAFENQLPDLLITMAASLKAGHSFRSSVQSVVDEGQPPAAKEFRRVLTETQLGRPMDDALGDMAERVGSDDLSFVITSVTIQRQVGGSLAGLFDMVAETVRQRQQFARKVRSLTAMGRMSAYTLMALPFLVALIVMVLSPSYLSPLFHTKSGHEMVFAALLMMGIGSVVLKKIVSFRG